ncbi:hypothetical protein [Staphylococcus phage vB_StaM_SA1]|nr:hypothetical protein [Staphylococcus phage vB_StaM_SA1]
MKFAIANVEFFDKLGYNTEHWRKSVDGTLTICHLEYAEILSNNLHENEEVQIVEAPEALDIMSTDVWSSTEEETN